MVPRSIVETAKAGYLGALVAGFVYGPEPVVWALGLTSAAVLSVHFVLKFRHLLGEEED